MIGNFEQCYRAVESRDARFDGQFYTGVRTTGIYCRPSCPAQTPKPGNVVFFRTAAAAQGAGLRACKRCLPDATPGSPEWNLRADLAGRAMRFIADGVIDREGVDGLSRRLGYSPRHVHRQLTREVGAGPLALARAQRATTARTLIERTDLPFARIAFASGFSSLRQFNDTVRTVYALSPTQLRRQRGDALPAPADRLHLRLPYRTPGDPAETLGFLGRRAVTGVEQMEHGRYHRTLSLPFGAGVVTLDPSPGDPFVSCVLELADLRDLPAAVERCRRLLDLDADPGPVDGHLAKDPLLAPQVRARPGRRLPGTVDGFESAVRAILGQQISVKAAQTLAGRVTAAAGKPLDRPVGSLTHLFPSAEALASTDLGGLGLPQSRIDTLRRLALEVAEGRIDLGVGADREALAAALGRCKGIGPWTVSYVLLRLGDPDAFPATDAGVLAAIRAAGLEASALPGLSERWRPWRGYAVRHLWASL